MSKKLLALVVGVCLLTGVSQVGGTGKVIELVEQDYWSEETGTSGKALLEMIGRYEKANPDVKIKHVYIPFGQLVEKVLMQTMTRSLPDIVFIDNPDLPHVAQAGTFLDITSKIKEWGEWQDFYAGSQQAVTLEGKVYAIHMVTNNLALFYNRDFFGEAGLPGPPETWDELITYAGKLTKGNRYGIAFSAVNTEECTWQFEPFLWSNKGDLMNLNSPEAIEALNLWVTLIEKGYASEDVVNWNQGDVGIQFRTGKAAMIIQGCWDIPLMREAGINFGIAKIPVPKKGMNPVVPMGGECFGISPFTTETKQMESWDFIKWLASPEQMADLNILINDVPTRKSAATIVAKREPILKPFIDQLENAVPRSVAGGGTKYTQISTATRKAIQKALIGQATPREAFEEAAAEIEKIMSK